MLHLGEKEVTVPASGVSWALAATSRPRHHRERSGPTAWDHRQQWTRLDIVRTDRGGLFDTTGTVEFYAHYRRVHAHYREAGRPGTLHEHSRFVRKDGRWLYLDALPQAG